MTKTRIALAAALIAGVSLIWNSQQARAGEPFRVAGNPFGLRVHVGGIPVGYGGGFYRGNIYGNPYSPYGGYGRGHYHWHDTTHYDFHPGYYRPHGNHLDYVPGHLHLHPSGHLDYHHRGHYHHHGH